MQMRSRWATSKRKAQGLVEYGLVLVLAAIGAIIMIALTADKIINLVSTISSAMVALQ
ncbi:MAG TPA: pilus assembly protein [Chloroflexia bacterium]|nr:pilus assembly protein [Chloroflexia bacterium]